MKIAKYLAWSTLGLTALCLPALAFSATTITVQNNHDSGDGSLRNAIVNVAEDGDTVSIPDTIGQIDLTDGEIQVLKSITIQGAGAGTTIIDGTGNDRVFEIGGTANVSVRIVGLTIQNGNNEFSSGGGIFLNEESSLLVESSRIGSVDNPNSTLLNGGGIFSEGFLTVVDSTIDGNLADANGGGIDCDAGSVTLVDTTASNNEAGFGGGIVNDFCVMTIQGSHLGEGGCNITGNSSGGEGGGIGTDEAETLIDTCTISGNTANGDFGGGGIGNFAFAVVLNSVITGNHAIVDANNEGGGGILDFGTMLIDHTTISNNDSTNSGGGFLTFSDSGTIITNTTISENEAGTGTGGGIWSEGKLDISNTTLFKNQAGGSGGGFFNRTSEVRLNNVTISGNVADADANDGGDGGGLAGNVTTLTIRNTIVAGNVDNSPTADKDPDCSTANGFDVRSEGHNLIGVANDRCVLSGDPTGNVLNQAAGLDPEGLKANGSEGPLTLALVEGSPAIDAGDTATATVSDARGVERPQGEASDIGAFEFVAAVPTPAPSAVPTPTPAPGSGQDDNGGGCALVKAANSSASSWMGLLSLAAAGLAVRWRRAK